MLKEFVSRDFVSYEDFVENYKVKVPENFNFAYDVVDKIAEKNPDKTAIVWCNDLGEEKRITFLELKEYSNRAANFFKSTGVRKGDRVMVILKSRYEFWYCILGLHKLGAVCVPATHMLKTRDIVYRLNAADIKMVISVAMDGILDSIDEAQKQSPSLLYKSVVGGDRKGWINFNEKLETSEKVFERPVGDEGTTNSDMSLLYFTSGTTGYPKMVSHNFTYPLGHIHTAKYWQNVKDGGLHYTVADTGWAKAVWGQIYGQWICNSAVFVYDYHNKFSARDILKAIEKYRVTTFCAPPTIYRFMIKEDLTQYDLSSLEYCVVAGEPLNPEVYNKFLQMTGIKLMEGYGQTELTVTIGTFPWMKPKPGSMGKPAPGYHIELLDEEGNPCEVGQEGQIVIRTDKQKPLGMFDGYYRDPEKTREVWKDGIYYTGDMAWYDEDGYFWFVGRADDVIKSSGYRIGPFEVESALMEHPSVVECAVTAAPDELRGQVVKATIVLAKGYKPSDRLKKELQDHVKRVTAPYKYPRIVEFVEELPKTISGKIRRVEIREKEKKQS
ncbi:MAG TPA: AMP-binding protein [Clostridiales bacterium]|nr:AMP-binding protein [Clostridiales bacterium]